MLKVDINYGSLGFLGIMTPFQVNYAFPLGYSKSLHAVRVSSWFVLCRLLFSGVREADLPIY